MNFIKELDLFNDSGDDDVVVLRVCFSCSGDKDHGASLSICGSTSSPSDSGKWVV